jgi:hypothetical protein
MTTDRDRTRIVLSWLHEDAHEDAERVLLRTLDEVETTQQRRPWWPARRSADMNSYAKLAIAVAAVIVVVVAGIQLLPRTGTTGGQPTAAPSPTASPSAMPSPTATPAPSLPPLTSGSLAPGRYALVWGGPSTSVAVPAGWTGDPLSVSKEAADLLWGGWPGPVTQVFSDACHEGTLKPTDGTRQGLVNLLDAQLSTDATVTQVTLGAARPRESSSCRRPGSTWPRARRAPTVRSRSGS